MKYKRKKILIHSLQVKYSLYLTLGMLVIMVLTFFNTYLDIITIVNNILPARGESYILFLDLITPLLLAKIFLLAGVIVLLGILVSHRIAGPIYRFTNIFQKVKNGELNIEEIKLRQKDELHDEAEELNDMVESLRVAIEKIKENVNTLSSQDNLNSPQAREILSGLKERVSFFKT